jgi:NAD+ kinase
VSVDRIAILVHPTRDVRRAISGLTTWAEEHDADVVQLGGPSHAPEGTIEGASLVVAIGGDGTVLAALRAAAAASLPVLGVACGSLGALTTIAAPDLADALDRFAADDWTAHHIPALAIEPETGETARAMNDLVVVRAGGSQVTSSVAVDGVLYGRFAGDGVVVSTQLGSSAYSMAAGGPVIAPGNGTWLITPLNPHGGCLPPVVVPASAEVRLEVEPGFAGARVEIDGRPAELELGAYDITLRDDFATLVRLGDEEDYFTGLRRRHILIDSPRVMARDARVALEPPAT